MDEFDEYRDWEPRMDERIPEEEIEKMVNSIKEHGVAFHTCDRPPEEADERDYIESMCDELGERIGDRLNRSMVAIGLPIDWEKRNRYYFEVKYEREPKLRIYRQQISDVADQLYLDHRAVLSIDLNQRPHTQEGQRPNIDWPADQIIDEYIAQLRDNVGASSRKREIVVTPRLQKGSTIDFDVRYAS